VSGLAAPSGVDGWQDGAVARILVVQHDYPPAELGGYGVMCAQVCHWLADRGHQLLVLTTRPAAAGAAIGDDKQARASITVRRVLVSYWDEATQECVYPSFTDALAIERANHAHLRAALAEHQPEVVSFWHMGALSLGLITDTAQLGLPIVFVVGDDWLCYGGWADGWLRRFADDPDPKRAELVARQTGLPTRLPDLGELGVFCFVSDLLRRRAEQVGGWRLRRWLVAHPGVATAQFPRPYGDTDELALAREWSRRLLWIGRVTAAKGAATAIQALASLPERAGLRVVGPVQPDTRQDLEALAAAHGVAGRVSFAIVPHQRVRACYQQADVTLFTSALANEGFGLVQLEAMASGCPLVTSGAGGAAEFCTDADNCLLVPPGDPAALAAAVRRLAADPPLRVRLVAGGLRTAATLTLDRQASLIEQALLSATARRRQAVPPERRGR